MRERNWNSRRRFLKASTATGVVALAGCIISSEDSTDGGKTTKQEGTPGDEQLRQELGLSYPDWELEDEVNVLHWEEYWHNKAVKEFEQAFDVSVSLKKVPSLNDYIADMDQSSFNEYDVVFPSDFQIQNLIGNSWLKPLDMDKLTNWDNLAQRWIDNAPYDIGEKRYSAPYQWGTTGIGWNGQLIDGSLDEIETLSSWDAMWDERFAGQTRMLGAMREVYAAPLKRLGESLNTTDQATIQEATDLLVQQKERMDMTSDDYSSADLIETLLDAEASPMHTWSGEGSTARFNATEGVDVRYVIPEEGGVIWIDSGVIPAGAQNPGAAHAMINYTLAKSVAAKITNYTFFPSPNEAAEAEIFDEILNDNTIYPQQKTQEKLEFRRDVGEALTDYEDGWETLMAA